MTHEELDNAYKAGAINALYAFQVTLQKTAQEFGMSEFSVPQIGQFVDLAIKRFNGSHHHDLAVHLANAESIVRSLSGANAFDSQHDGEHA